MCIKELNPRKAKRIIRSHAKKMASFSDKMNVNYNHLYLITALAVTDLN
jgi:hypothetical protein